MTGIILPERLERVRQKLSENDIRMLAQGLINHYATLAYREGRADGKRDILEKQAKERARKVNQKVPAGKPSCVYFIQSSAAIKIGTTINPMARLMALQTSQHEPLEIVALCEGGTDVEGEYHKRFARHRLSGEWFAPHPDILAEIARLSPSPTVASNRP